MKQALSNVLDIYRFAQTAASVDYAQRDDLEVVTQVFLEANQMPYPEAKAHFEQFQGFLRATERAYSPEATHLLLFDRLNIPRKYLQAMACDTDFLLFDLGDVEIEGRFRLAEIDPYLRRSLTASVADHAAEKFWQFMLALAPVHHDGNTIRIFLNRMRWDGFSSDFPIFRLGELLEIGSRDFDV